MPEGEEGKASVEEIYYKEKKKGGGGGLN